MAPELGAVGFGASIGGYSAVENLTYNAAKGKTTASDSIEAIAGGLGEGIFAGIMHKASSKASGKASESTPAKPEPIKPMTEAELEKVSGGAKDPGWKPGTSGTTKPKEIIPKYPDMTHYEFNAVQNPGPLAKMEKNPASNFFGGRYNMEVLSEDRIYYRAGNNSEPLGQWFTREPAESAAQVRSDLAVRSQWINPKSGELEWISKLDAVYSIKIPKGTTVYEGPVGPQGGVYQGGPQIMQTFIPEPWYLTGVNVLSKTPLK